MTRTEIETWLAGPGRKHVEAAAKADCESGKYDWEDFADSLKNKYIIAAEAHLTAFLTSMLEDGTAATHTGWNSMIAAVKEREFPVIIIKLEAQ
jgi:hypothetical protein